MNYKRKKKEISKEKEWCEKDIEKKEEYESYDEIYYEQIETNILAFFLVFIYLLTRQHHS